MKFLIMGRTCGPDTVIRMTTFAHKGSPNPTVTKMITHFVIYGIKVPFSNLNLPTM